MALSLPRDLDSSTSGRVGLQAVVAPSLASAKGAWVGGAIAAVVESAGTAAAGAGVDELPVDAALRLRAPETDARSTRRQFLRAQLPKSHDTLPPSREVAARVLANMTMSVGEQAALLGAGLSRVLKKPLPYDSANLRKPALMLELMPSVGATKLASLAWQPLYTSFTTTPQATPFVLMTGVSGMGKTKVAYDIGRTEAFVVLERVVEHDALTLPWDAFRVFAAEVIRTAAPAGVLASHDRLPLSERVSLKAALIVLLGAHLEWAVMVSEAAVRADCAAALDSVCAASAYAGSPHARERVLQELVIRAQRNGLAYQQVAELFRNKLADLLDAPGVIREDGTLKLPVASALQYISDVTDRATAVWARRTDRGDVKLPRIVWAHDEVQALLHVDGLPRDLFDGVFEAERTTTSPTSRSGEHRGCFYGLLAAIRDVIKCVHSGHLLLGNNLDLSAQLLGRHSPAQGMAKCVDEAINLSVDDIRELLDAYLTPEAMAGADAGLLEKLRGRALFLSHFWPALARHCSSSTVDAACAVREALREAEASATKDAERLISALWGRYEPHVGSGQVPSRLMRHLFHELVMASGTDAALDTSRMRRELVQAIQCGVLNAKADSSTIQLDAEPCTAAALREVGMRRLKLGEDGVMALLAARMTEPPGGEDADLGPAQEACFAWGLVRRCLLRGADASRMTLGELLGPYFARCASTMDVRGNVHAALLPSACDEYEVALMRGCRADGEAWQRRCPLELLERVPDVLVHHTTNRMGGPDIMFLARHRVTGDTKLVVLQMKNRVSDTLDDALPSVDLAKWYADARDTELPAHARMRALLATHRQWALPIRVLVGARSVDARVLLSTAWLNRAELASSPVLLLHLTRENLGADVVPRGAIPEYSTTRGWPKGLWPRPRAVTRYWDAPVPALPALPPCPASPVVASLRVQFTSRASKDAMVAEVEDQVRAVCGNVDFVRHRRLLSFSHAITATFTHAAAAFVVFRRAAEGTLVVNGFRVTAVFV